RRRVEEVILSRHLRNRRGQPLQGTGYDRSLGGRKLGGKTETPALVQIPPLERPGVVDLGRFGFGRATKEISSAADRAARHFVSPADQSPLRWRRREPGELVHLADPV